MSDEALKIGAFPQGEAQIPVISEVATALVKAGDTNRALQLAQSLATKGDADTVLGYIAVALVEEGNVNQGVELFNSLEKPEQWWTINSMVRALVAQGEVQQAVQLSNYFLFYEVRPSALSSVAVKLAQIGEIEQAMEILQSVEEQDRGIVLANIVVKLAEQGDINRAREISQSIVEEEIYNLENGIIVLGAKGKLTAAKQLVQFLPNNAGKARVLNELATSYIAAGEKEQATELLNEALTIIN